MPCSFIATTGNGVSESPVCSLPAVKLASHYVKTVPSSSALGRSVVCYVAKHGLLEFMSRVQPGSTLERN